MIRFDTLDKKPKVYSVAVAAAITLALLLLIQFRFGAAGFQMSNNVLTVFFLIAILLFIRAFFRQLRYNPYSYNTIYYSGFAIFLCSALYNHVRVAILARSYPAEAGLASVLSYLKEAPAFFIFISAPFILIFSLVLLISNISLIRHEGRRLVNVLGIILSFLLVGGLAFIFLTGNASGSRTEVMIHDLAVGLAVILYLYFESMIIGVIIASAIAVHCEPDPDKDFIIILGCGIRRDGTPTPLLRGRVDRAVAFRNRQLTETGKDLRFVVSGGQGPDEVISEAECMKNYLLTQGIPEERIILEDKSTDTAENMLFSKEKIAQAGGADGKIAYSTTNYHVFRGGLKARRVKMRAVGMGAKTKWYFWPNAAVREFVGLLTEHRLKQGLVLGGLIALHVMFTILAYQLEV